MEKEEILNYLEQNGKTSITKLSVDLKIHYYKIKTLIEELKKENKIKIIKNRHYTYVELNITGGYK